MPKIYRRLRDWLARRKLNLRGLLAVSGIVAIANGLAYFHPALPWLAIGIFLMVSAASPDSRKAP